MEEQVTIEIEKQTMTHQRNYWIDFFKCIMALFIVGIHTTAVSNPKWLYLIINNGLFRLAVPFFFVCSGFFVYSKYIESGKDSNIFLKHGLKFLVLYVIWNVIYLPITVKAQYFDANIAVSDFLIKFFQEFIFYSPMFVFWYLRCAGVSLLLIGLLLKFKINIVYIFVLSLPFFIFGSFADFYYGFLPEGSSIKGIYDTYLSIFLNSKNSIFFGIPSITSGAIVKTVLDKYDILRGNKSLFFEILLLVFLLSCLLVESYFVGFYTNPKDSTIHYSTLFLAPVVLTCLIRAKQPNSSLFWQCLSGVSSLVYFLHIMCLTLFHVFEKLLKIEEPSTIIVFLVVSVLSFIFSIIYVLLSRTKHLSFLSKLY